MKKFIGLIFVLFLIGNVLAECNEGQIDINNATLEELDEIPEIGYSIAQGIIDGRPFSSLDELIDVKWIGPTNLQQIKDDGIACVEFSSPPLVPEFGFFVGILTIISALGIFFVVRRE